MRYWHALLLAAGTTLAASACSSGSSSESDGPAESSFALTDGTPAAVAVLNLLNACTTTLEILDDSAHVGLDSRAATALVEHRDGADATCGTGDDDLYDDIAEVDAQYFVGGSALQKLAQYAALQGYEPGPNEFLVACDGVDFTVSEAEAFLGYVNETSVDVLDAIPYVQMPAAEGIVSGRPYESVLEVCALDGVGTGTVTRIKTAALEAAGATGLEDGAACVQEQGDPNPCEGDLRCAYDDGAGCGFCVNYDSSQYQDEGSDCTSDADCDTGVCAGTTVYGGNGYCQLPWLRRTFVVEESGGLEIPVGGTLTVEVPVCGLASVPEDMILESLDISGDLASYVLEWDANNGSTDEFFNGPNGDTLDLPRNIYGIERDNSVNNMHLLHIRDAGGSGGTFYGLQITISSRFD